MTARAVTSSGAAAAPHRHSPDLRAAPAPIRPLRRGCETLNVARAGGCPASRTSAGVHGPTASSRCLRCATPLASSSSTPGSASTRASPARRRALSGFCRWRYRRRRFRNGIPHQQRKLRRLGIAPPGRSVCATWRSRYNW